MVYETFTLFDSFTIVEQETITVSSAMHTPSRCVLALDKHPDTFKKLNKTDMKKKFMTLIFALTTMLTFAQTSEHLSFKGVPIDGTLDEYVSKMKQNGFTHVGTEDGVATLEGEFAGYKDCYVGVSTLKQKDLVHKIVVIFAEKNTWTSLSGNYFDLKKMLTEKYGKPTEVVEKFDTYSQPRDDNSRMHEVGMDRCKYSSIWQTDKGVIQLSIEHEIFISFVILGYFDRINSEIIKAKAIDDL